MNVNDWVAIAAFGSSILGMAYALGKQAYRLQILDKDINAIANQQREDQRLCDKRLDKLSEFAVRVDQRILHLEERVFGDDTAARMRDM